MSSPSTHSGVMVGVDGSPAAKYAVNWAAREAVRRKVGLTLIHAVRPIGLTPPADDGHTVSPLASEQ